MGKSTGTVTDIEDVQDRGGRHKVVQQVVVTPSRASCMPVIPEALRHVRV